MSAPFTSAPARPYTRRLLLVGCVLLSLLWLLSSSSSSRRRTAAPIERAIPGTTYTFSTYLDAHFPLHATQELHDDSVESTHARSSLQIILTIAGSQWLDTATAALQLSLATVNQQREARAERPVQLVVLTLDDGALQKCRERGMYCYGGYRGMDPIKGTPRDWYKASGVRDVLSSGRDVFYIESDVNLKKDPIAPLEPYFASVDIIAGEMPAGTLNTGFVWIKKSEKTIALFEQIVELSIAGGKVQDDFNRLLGAQDLLQTETSFSPHITSDNLRVRLLNTDVFRAVNLLYDPTEVEHPEAVSLQLSCAGDIQNRIFVAQSLGYFPDLNGYYTKPRSLLKIDELRGTVAEVVQQMKILLTVARYSHRSLEVPAFATFTDLDLVRPIWSSFPVSRLSKTVGVTVVEPGYSSHSIQHLALTPQESAVIVEEPPETLLGEEETVASVEDPDFGLGDENDEEGIMASLQSSAELDLRNCETLPDLLHRLLSHAYHHELVLTLTNFHTAPNWRRWELPAPVANLTTCLELEKAPNCANICKRAAEEGGRKAKWPLLRDVMLEPGAW